MYYTENVVKHLSFKNLVVWIIIKTQNVGRTVLNACTNIRVHIRMPQQDSPVNGGCISVFFMFISLIKFNVLEKVYINFNSIQVYHQGDT